jgi:hypothetical protein
MKRVLIAMLSSLVLLAAAPLRAAVCDTARPASGDVFAVDHYITDAILHRRWAVLVDCTHQDRPWTLEAAPWQDGAGLVAVAGRMASGTATVVKPLIPAGAKVRLWRTADGANIELAGTALEAGMAGQVIHVRTGARGTVLEGRVRGAGSVELFSADRWTTQ